MREDKVIDFSPGNEGTQPELVSSPHPNHIDFLGEVVAKHLVLSKESFGDETAKQQILQAFRIVRDDKSFVQLINQNLEKHDSKLRVSQAGAFFALTRDGMAIPLDTISIPVRAKKSESTTPKVQVADQKVGDTNFRVE